jgi:hypothetical protein
MNDLPFQSTVIEVMALSSARLLLNLTVKASVVQAIFFLFDSVSLPTYEWSL